MKDFFNIRFIITLLILLLSAVIIFFSVRQIELDASIQSLFPENEELLKKLALTSKSPVTDKVMIFIETHDKKTLENIITEIDILLADAPIQFSNVIPNQEDILDIIAYSQKYSLLLYPYEQNADTFRADRIKNGLENKTKYLMGLPFFVPEQEFWYDPLMLGMEIFNQANETKKGKYSPKFGGIISKNGNAYLKILRSGIGSENYKQINQLVTLNNRIIKLGETYNCTAFLYSAHLYFHESSNRIKFDISIIFILNIISIITIFYFFFRRLSLLIINFMPIVAGFAITFLVIALFKKVYGGIALAFGAATAGIAIDYNIHYLTKKNYYSSLKEVRKKIGPSLIMGFITTLVSFIFLPFSKITSLKEIALFGIIGISFTFLFSWFILQQLVKPEIDLYNTPPKSINFKPAGKKWFIIWLCIMILLLFFIPFISFEDNLLNLDMKHKKLKNNLKLIQNHFSESSDSIFLVFTGNNRDEILEKSLQAYYEIKKHNDTLSFYTPALFFPSQTTIDRRKTYIKNNFKQKIFTRALEKSVFSAHGFDPFINTIKNIDSFSIDNMPRAIESEMTSLFILHDNKEYLMIPVYEKKVLNEIHTILKYNNHDFFIVDFVHDTSSGLISFEKTALILLLLSTFIIYIILFIFYKNPLEAFCALLPCICALLACVALTVVLPGGYNIMHFVSSILLLGIGVDYGIFITGSLKNNYCTQELSLTYQSIFISALTTIASFGILVISKNNSIFSLGSSMFIGISTAFFTSYTAIPILLKRKPRNNTKNY